MNIVGKRSGDGFVAHKAVLVSALSRALAERVTICDVTVGRKGLLGYIKSLSGNVVKFVPDSAVDLIKFVCGNYIGNISAGDWIGEKTPLTLCDVRVSPNNAVKPNIGSLELAEALNRVLPFTATDDARPVLACVNFIAKEGKLTIVSADGFRLAKVTLDYDDGEGQALVNRDDLKGISNALKRAKRARVSFEPSGTSLDGISLIIDTELIRYKWVSVNGNYPEYEKLIPTEFNTFAHLDTVEAIKAIASLKFLSEKPKAYPIDLTIGDGKIVLANPDDKGQAELVADTDGQGFVRIDGQYLAEALRACGGMVEFKLTNSYSPMLFTTDGYQVVVMPQMSNEASESQKRDYEAKQAEPVTEPVAEAEAEAHEAYESTEGERLNADEKTEAEANLAGIISHIDSEPVAEPKPKRNRKKVAVA